MNKIIFFDLDDTLYFRKDAFYIAFNEFFQNKHSDVRATANDRCRMRGDEVFYQAQNGTITTEEMYIYRFQTGFRDVGIEITPEQALEFLRLYKKSLYDLRLNSTVVSMLNCAKEHFEKLGIITNGESAHQRNKIKKFGLDQWIDSNLIVISGEHGCPKPDKRLFEIAAEKAHKNPEDLIIIGDSLLNDIIPADEMGWHSIWINLYNEHSQPPEYEVKEVNEIPLIFELQKECEHIKQRSSQGLKVKDEIGALLESCENAIKQNNFEEAVKMFKEILVSDGVQASVFLYYIAYLFIKQGKVNFKINELFTDDGMTTKAKQDLQALTDQDIKSTLEIYTKTNFINWN